MEISAENLDLWGKILAALGNGSRGRVHSEPLPWQETSFFSTCVKITVLECCDGFASIEWNDPTQGHYAEQRWQRCIARRNGICALSGESIVRGDCVYQPARKLAKPVNSCAMILARALPIVEQS